MFNKIVSNIHWAIIFWMIFNIHEAYTLHMEKMAELQSRLPIIQRQATKIKKELALLETHFSNLKKAEEKLKKVAQNMEKLQRQLPESILDVEVINYMMKVGEDLNINDINVKSEPEVERDFYFTKIFTVSATGTYLQFLLFLEKLGASERFMNVGSVKFQRSKKALRSSLQLVDINMSVISYRYNPDFGQGEGTDNIESGKGITGAM